MIEEHETLPPSDFDLQGNNRDIIRHIEELDELLTRAAQMQSTQIIYYTMPKEVWDKIRHLYHPLTRRQRLWRWIKQCLRIRE